VSCPTTVVWHDGYLGYDFGPHPMSPWRLRLTMDLARQLGVLDHVAIEAPEPADEALLLTAHSPAYLNALRAASVDRRYAGHGLGTADTPRFDGMYDVCALIAGGSDLAARRVWARPGEHAVNIAGGLHHALADEASGFCAVNDAVIAIRTLLASGARRVAYVDIDVHHGDGVQEAFHDDPRVLTVSLHQDPRTLFPGTGRAEDIGAGEGAGASVNVALPPGTDDSGWLRAFGAVVPGLLRVFAPDVLVTQCGCDTHVRDPLAELRVSLDGQRTAIAALHRLAHEHAGGRWLALGGGGYNVTGCVPVTWTHLIAEMSGRPLPPSTPVPDAWRAAVIDRAGSPGVPTRMGETDAEPDVRAWEPGEDTALDRAIFATRSAVFPLHGLDPHDPRD
jgi:acetoin utilization protein AcuC